MDTNDQLIEIMEENKKVVGSDTSEIIGYILLIPPLIGVLAFLLGLLDIHILRDSSMVPVYLGLTAIAGAYLIKGRK